MWELILARSSSPTLSKILLGLLILILVEERSALGATPRYEDCAPQTCGKHLVQYPFSLKEQNHSFCGPPPFALSCDDSTLTLTFFRFPFKVINIFYDNRSIQVTFGDYDPCILLLTNTVIDAYPFALSRSNRQILFLYNCLIEGEDDLQDYEKITCPRFNSTGFYGGEYNPEDRTNLSHRNCNSTIMPVMSYSNLSASRDYRPLLRTGWLSDWVAPDCTACNNSGGRCGYDSATVKFICICQDGINSSRCGGMWHSCINLCVFSHNYE